jgi:hypothetical protein
MAPIAAYYRGTQCTPIKAWYITAVMSCTKTINYTKMVIMAMEISARSIHAGSAMAMICGRIDLDSIRMMGRWHNDVMMRYLQAQAQPIINKYASKMYNNGT